MRLLLDTHILLWWLADPGRIAEEARLAISDPENEVFYSAANIWEIKIKSTLGKLAPMDRGKTEAALQSDSIHQLAIDACHAWAVGSLPLIHSDPFDRILIAQAVEESLTLVTRDDTVQRYPVSILRA